MTFDSYTIVITGIGGQGLISFIQILGGALMNKGYKVITSETHGLSQRGGKVTCFLRFGDKLNAPIPMIGTADMIIATEKSCILDVIKYAKPNKSTKLIIYNYERSIINETYPSQNYLLNVLKENSDNIYFIPAIYIAEKIIETLKTANIVILGYILRFLPLNEKDIEKSLKQHFLGKDLEINLNALKEGKNQ
ncbi:MAG: 2-oxoacid:acceptor oxidoreductase family protein [Candidatus Hodarchaeota archaeon]